MEAVARQFATDARCLVLRNGWFSYRWSQILERGRIAADETVLTARPVGEGKQAPFAPAPVDRVRPIFSIRDERTTMFVSHSVIRRQ